nr:XkdX family protein [Ruminiclostridium cellobioparum]
MFERLNYLYHAEKLTAEQLDIAVSKSWITTEQRLEITG